MLDNSGCRREVGSHPVNPVISLTGIFLCMTTNRHTVQTPLMNISSAEREELGTSKLQPEKVDA